MIYIDAKEAIKKIHRGKRIFIGSGCAEPQYLVNELSENSALFSDNEIVHLLTTGEAPYVLPKYKNNFRHNAFFIGPNVRKAVSNGDADYTPIFLSDIPHLFKSGQMPIHCAIVQVSPPDENNEVSLGISVDIEKEAVLNAEIIIAQVNRYMPRTHGLSRINVNEIDFLVVKDEPILELPKCKLDETSLRIGNNVSKIIRDGDTLQLGIGKIPDAVLKNLVNKKDLGVHTEMFSNGIIDLYKNGNITNKRKAIHRGVSITSFIMGTRELYDLVDDNHDFEFHPSDYVNDPYIISKNSNMVSINSALEIDLTGQVCADSIGQIFYSGIGGQVDFVRGAKRSPGGRSIIAIPSTAKNGDISRIVSNLSNGAGVVTSRGDIEYVVTEYGIAYLHGRTIRERSLSLIQIAHPDFREELLNSLKSRHYVYFDQKTINHDISVFDESIPYKKKVDNKDIYFRILQQTDEKTLQDFFYSQSVEKVYQQFFTYKKTLSHEEAQEYTTIDYNKDIALGGFDSEKPYAKMICFARYIKKDANTASFGISVNNNYQKKGLGKYLINLLKKIAKLNGITRLIAYVSYTNIPMLQLCEKNGFVKEEYNHSEILKFSICI